MSDAFITRDTISGILSSDGSLNGSLTTCDPLVGRVSTSEISDPEQLDGYLSIPRYRYLYEKDYEQLDNKPSVNSVTLINDKSFDELGLNAISNTELENLLR